MKRTPWVLAGMSAAFVILAGTEASRSETWNLGLKRLGSSSRVSNADEMMFRSTYPQTFALQTGGTRVYTGRSVDEGVPDFSKVVTKDRGKYECSDPFRGVVRLGGQFFGFALDGAPASQAKPTMGKAATESKQNVAAARKPQAYTLLYFDVNHNGDLTDDTAIKAESAPLGIFTFGYANSTFPRVDLSVEAEGVKIDYAFFFSVYSYVSESYSFAQASLNAAAYREGEITLDGKPTRIVLVDFNSNGRFDDKAVIDERVTSGDGAVYLQNGDMIFVDPQTDKRRTGSPYDPAGSDSQHHLSQLLFTGGRFYEVKTTAAGDKITIEPCTRKTGHVTNPNAGYRAVVYGDQGVVKIASDDSGRAMLPAGNWKLASYTIFPTSRGESPKPKAEQPSLLSALAGALLGGGAASAQRFTLVAANAKRDYPAVAVGEGETATLPFGPPYKPLVSVSYVQPDKTASLGLSLVGSAGELCNDLMVNGRRPAAPAFTISDAKGAKVISGNFEYG